LSAHQREAFCGPPEGGRPFASPIDVDGNILIFGKDKN